MRNNNIEKITTEFVLAFAEGNSERLRKVLAENVKSYITNAIGGVNLLDGSDALIHNLEVLDVKNVKPEIRITQTHKISENQIMIMIEAKIKRKGKSFQNYAAYLMTFKNGLIVEIRMVEAFPAESDAFWKS